MWGAMPFTRGHARPDAARSLAQYRRRAPHYDLELMPFEPVRRQAIALLDVGEGATVLDIGCGTGLSFAGLLQRVGPQGRVIGVEPSPEMLALARARVQRHGWQGVELLQAPAASAPLPRAADAVLFHFTHDVLRDPAALDHVLAHLRPGAHVVACGLQWAPFWMLPANLFVLGAALYSVSSLEGLELPWTLLAKRLKSFEARPMSWPGIYMAQGRSR
jgi:demethylmenaquinone methyltransferase/2-methoxy-6-polyprenyl-1,4-benzoquinol methylase